VKDFWKNLVKYGMHLAGQVFHFFTQTFFGKLLLKYGIALILLAYVLYKNWDGIVKVTERTIHFEPLIIATLIYAVGLIITFLRWHLLVRAVDLPFSRYNAVRLGLVGFYFNTFLPGSIGGDVVKAYAIARESNRRTLAVATVLIDRIVGLWALIWFVALVGSAFWILDDKLLRNETLRAIILSTIIFVIVSMTIWFALGFLSDDMAARLANRLDGKSRLRHSMAELWRACWMYRKRSRAVLIAMLVTLVAHAGWVLVFHFSVLAFPPPNASEEAGDLAEHAIIVPVGMTVSAFVPLPGGIGVGEAAFGRLYTILGKPEVNGVVGCMSQRVITYSLGLLGYIIYLRMRRGIPVENTGGETAGAPIDPVPPLPRPVTEP
jgi:glycosyltransferase 2 family protein